MNLQEELKVLKERIAKLEEQIKDEQEFPKDGDEYWYLGSSGEVMNTMCGGYDFEIDRLELGNVFKTKEQVEFLGEKLKVEAELRKYSKPFKRDSLNFIMCFDTEEDELYSETRRFMNQGSIYFGWGQAECAMNVVGKDRIKKYIFGVED